MRRFLPIILVIALILGMLASCTASAETESDSREESSIETTERLDNGNQDESSDTDKKEDGEKVTESESETEAETEPVDPAIPTEEADYSYTTYDGYVFKQYNNKGSRDYLAACAYFEAEGYTLYSNSLVGTASSATYYKDDAYAVVMINRNKSELYIGQCESGASNLPPDTSDYLELNETTVTQVGTPEQNGMCYIFRLADGSFIIFDGGLYADADHAYETLVRLNDNSAYGIHIRAWFITHSHGDHYQMFSKFSELYAKNVTLDNLYYCAVSGQLDEDVAQDSFLNTRVAVELNRFEGAKSFQIHAGMAFDIADLHVQVLTSPEHTYKDHPDNTYFNESSVVCRLSNEDGSIIINGDIGEIGCTFMMECYGDGLKSDMVQMAHHGVENAPGSYYDYIRPTTVFIPYDESLSGSGRAKQHIFQSDYAKEILAHGYGDVTRLLSHKAEDPECIDIMPATVGMITGMRITDIALNDDGSLTYKVAGGEGVDGIDAYFYYSLNKKYGVDPEYHNVIKIVAKGKPFFSGTGEQLYSRGGEFFYASQLNWSADKSVTFYQQGHSTNEICTYYLYLGDCEDYVNGNVNFFRFDIGSVGGEEVTIYSIEMLHVEID